uniref:Uncharacterized protein n=1 Tax=Siphoviridae sp. ctzpQ31 TaxID=2823613 RepID=A0A8S5L883_9CAUD|nr:MAG TPA: hypothetical protein [Siphoviridae sp. ctzpQ31]
MFIFRKNSVSKKNTLFFSCNFIFSEYNCSRYMRLFSSPS